MRGFLQRLAGYCLSGEVREHYLPFHFGTGANGKGTFLEHGILKLAGSYGAKLTDSLVYHSDRGALPHLELANLCGKRFALGEENSEGGKLNEALLKSITGGDRQKGRFHYGNFLEYLPTYKVQLVGNHQPRIDGTDDGIWRRFLLVDWPVQIPTGQRDPLLKVKFAAEMSGILNWCLAGAREWLAGGLRPPSSCTAATAVFRTKSDELAEFIGDHFVEDAESYATKADVFVRYEQWARAAGIKHPKTKRALGIALVNRGWQETTNGHEKARVWVGWRLKTQIEE
jgi:putative DNA primase/helicase